VQFYTSEYLDSSDPGLGGEKYGMYGGLCLEDQMFPDALHHHHFPSILVTPDKTYRHWCEIEIK
jgi:aldose 1-epimerase